MMSHAIMHRSGGKLPVVVASLKESSFRITVVLLTLPQRKTPIDIYSSWLLSSRVTVRASGILNGLFVSPPVLFTS